MPSFSLSYYYSPSTDKETEREKVKHISQGQVVVTMPRSEPRKSESQAQSISDGSLEIKWYLKE